MANTQPPSRLQLLPDDRRSDRVWVLLLILGLFVTVVSWLDWMF
jgi:hypothetical protein